MANHKSALKRARQNEIKRIRNMAHKTRAKSTVKAVRAALDGNSPDQAKESLSKAISILQKTAASGVIHKKNSSRRISRLARQVNKLQTA